MSFSIWNLLLFSVEKGLRHVSDTYTKFLDIVDSFDYMHLFFIFNLCFTLFGFYIPYVFSLNATVNLCMLQGGAAVWCIGFQKTQGQGVTILGGIIPFWTLMVTYPLFVCDILHLIEGQLKNIDHEPILRFFFLIPIRCYFIPLIDFYLLASSSAKKWSPLLLGFKISMIYTYPIKKWYALNLP